MYKCSEKGGLSSKPLGPLPPLWVHQWFLQLIDHSGIYTMYVLVKNNIFNFRTFSLEKEEWNRHHTMRRIGNVLQLGLFKICFTILFEEYFGFFFIHYKSQQCDLFVGLWPKKMCFEYWSSKTYFFQVWKRTDMQVMSRRQHPISERNQRRTYTSRGRHKIFNKWENPP